MVTWGSALEKHCKSIESVIVVERQRLKSLQEQLNQYGANRNEYFEREKEESKRRYDQIRWCKKQVHTLKNQYDNLRKAIIDAENRRPHESVFAHKKRSLKVVAAEIDSSKSEIEKIDKKLHQIREVNASIEKDQQKKLLECHANHGFIIKPRSSGCLQLGRLMMEQEDAKHALNSITDKKLRLLSVIRELEKNLVMIEKQCKLQEENIRIKESQELERNLTLIDNVYKHWKQVHDELQHCLSKARSKLHSLELMKEPKGGYDIQKLREKIEEDKKLAKSYRANVAKLNLVASTLYDDVVEFTRQKALYADNFMRNYEDAVRKVNMDIYKMKSENAELDAKIENIRKVNIWAKKDYEKKVVEQEENEPENMEDERLFKRFRVEEEEAKHNLQSQKESSRKVKEQIENMLDLLFNAQLQCFMKERMVEEMSNGLREVTLVNDMVIKKKKGQITNSNSVSDKIL